MKIYVKVIANAKISEIIEETKDLLGNKCLRVKIAKPPQDGKANIELIKIISQYFNVKLRDVNIIKGLRSSNKILEVNCSDQFN